LYLSAITGKRDMRFSPPSRQSISRRTTVYKAQNDNHELSVLIVGCRRRDT
jgi:hypothetical protein